MFGSDVKFYPQPDGKTFNVTVELAVSPVFFSWVFMFGGQVRIVSPKKVKDEFLAMTKAVLDKEEM